MNDYFSIGFESEAAFGKSTQSQVVLPIPENKRELPCDDCRFAEKCATDFTECSAFRNWSSGGDFRTADIARLIRRSK
jgi:hypothetical protein